MKKVEAVSTEEKRFVDTKRTDGKVRKRERKKQEGKRQKDRKERVREGKRRNE